MEVIFRSKQNIFSFCSRSSHRRCSVRNGVLRNFAKFTGQHLWQSLFFTKVAGLRPATLLKKGPWHRCFLVNFAKFLRTPFSQNTSRRLLPLFVFLARLSHHTEFGGQTLLPSWTLSRNSGHYFGKVIVTD